MAAINKTPDKAIRLKSKKVFYTFLLLSFEDVIALVKTLTYLEAKVYFSYLFSIKDIYSLTIEVAEFDRKIPLIASEFACFSARGKIIKELFFEYGNCIISENAVETIFKAFT